MVVVYYRGFVLGTVCVGRESPSSTDVAGLGKPLRVLIEPLPRMIVIDVAELECGNNYFDPFSCCIYVGSR